MLKRQTHGERDRERHTERQRKRDREMRRKPRRKQTTKESYSLGGVFVALRLPRWYALMSTDRHAAGAVPSGHLQV